MLPEGWTTDTLDRVWSEVLGGILTEEAYLSMRQAMRNDDMALTKELKALFRPHAAALERQGFVPDYLAYFLPQWVDAALRVKQMLGDRPELN
jgi:hypothetical protein